MGITFLKSYQARLEGDKLNLRVFRSAGIRVPALAVVVITLLLTGCGERYVGKKIASGMVARLPSLIGPADSYNVSVSGSATKMMSGRIRHITVFGKGVRPNRDLYIDDLTVDMSNVRFDTENERLESVEETTFLALLSEGSLKGYIALREPDLKDVEIQLLDGQATAVARPGMMGMGVNVTLAGKLQANSKNEVDFVPDSITVAGIPAPEMIRNYIMQRINPVMDLSVIKFPAKIKSITILPKMIKVEGTADLTHGMGAAVKGVE